MTCGPDCEAFVAKWERTDWPRISARPVAMLNTTPDYAHSVNGKTRNMVKKARGLYTYRRFEYNQHLDDMHQIDISQPERQGRPMTQSYVQPKRPTNPFRGCPSHRNEWHGAFTIDDLDLVAYTNLIVIDDLAILNRVISDLSPAAQNGLIAYLAELLHPDVRWINYLDLRSCQPGLRDFKIRCGFRETVIA